MRLTTYFALLADLAARHKAITATAENGRFVRLLISADPVQKQLDLSEFFGKLRSGLQARAGQAYLVAENYQADYADNHGDAQQRLLSAAFLVLEPVDLGNYDARDAAIARCEQTAEQLLGALVPALYDAGASYVDLGDAWLEHLSLLQGGHVGVRVNFSWREPATQDLAFNPDAFN